MACKRQRGQKGRPEIKSECRVNNSGLRYDDEESVGEECCSQEADQARARPRSTVQ